MSKSIPGFYFDEEKNRYFRIQPNQSTAAGIAQHSVDGVRQLQKSSKKRKLDEINASRRRNQNIVRCRQLQHPGLGGSLSAILSPLNPSQSLEIHSDTITSALRLTTDAIKPITSASFSRIHHDPHSAELFAFQTRYPDAGTDAAQPISTIHTHKRGTHSSHFISYGMPLQGTLCQGSPISLDICRVSSDLRILIAICSKSYGGTIYLRQMPEAHNAEALSYSGMEVQFLLGGVTPWSSSVSRDSPQFVVASSGGLYLTFASEDSWTLKQLRQQQPQRNVDEFLNVDWQGRNVISAGDRSGRVVFVDTRSQDWVARLKLRSAVSGIRKVNEHQLVVRGFDAMNLYDLRYAKRPHAKNSATKPWLSFPQYRSILRPTGNFDYDETLGLIATATDNPSRVALYSTRTGKLAPTKLNTHPSDATLNDIKFAISQTESTSLLLARDDTVEEWAYR
ncbi:MAG: hypothetical protein Q9160_005179 [Pyrenula sp. 1 TL-2023]